MDRFWSYFLSLTFNFSIWINTIVEGQCQHPCLQEDTCDFISIQNRCYYVYKDMLRGWEESKQHCQAERLQMMSLENEDLIDNIITNGLLSGVPSSLKPYRTGAWLGGKALNYPAWSFLNGTTVEDAQLDIWNALYTDWQILGYCGIFVPSLSSFYISIQGCYKEEHFLCRKRKCDKPARENCLNLLEEQKTWFEARLHCISIGGDLFYLRENERLSEFGLAEGSLHNAIVRSPKNVFIGMIHRLWEWHETSPIIYTNWASGQPNSYWQECLMMFGDTGEWHANQCNTPLLTLCQGEIIEIPTSTANIVTQSFFEQNDSSPNHVGPVTLRESTTTASNSTTSIPKGNVKASESAFIGHDPKTNRTIIIIMAALLGVFFLISIALIIYITCRRCRKKAEVEDSEFIDYNYYDGTVERTVNDAPERVTTNNINGNADDRAIVPEKPTTLPSYEDVHLYGNDVTNSVPKNKPVIKPKPKIGPVNGDVYSQVDQVRSASPMSANNTTYMNAY